MQGKDVEHFLELIDKAAAVLNKHSQVEDQWCLQGFAAGMMGRRILLKNDRYNDPKYGVHFRAGYEAALTLG